MAPKPDYDAEYERRIERHPNAVVDAAFDEGWLTFLTEDEPQTPLQRAINELARNLRFKHFDGDGCFEHGQ
ncbi:hypothetical protein [Micromonospora chersina]|uniref:hypothetical protein n=1 Tax=Micromonospora chersina TaxID=47854 RepID=UPI0037129149